MRYENNTQTPPVYLQYWVKKTIITNAVAKNNKSINSSKIEKPKSENKETDKDTSKDGDILQLILKFLLNIIL